jgi:hypothetical protein
LSLMKSSRLLPEDDDCSPIGPDEPGPVTVLNGQGRANVLLVGDHVSNLIPRVLNGLEPVAGFMSCAIPDLYLEHQKSLILNRHHRRP